MIHMRSIFELNGKNWAERARVGVMSGEENTLVEASQNPRDSRRYHAWQSPRRMAGPQEGPGSWGKAPKDEYEWRFGESNKV